MLARNVRRMSIMWPWRAAASLRVRTRSSGSVSFAIAALAAAISAAVICAKSFFCSTSRSDTVSRASSSTSDVSSSRLSSPPNSASWMRCAPGGGALGAARGPSGSMAAINCSI